MTAPTCPACGVAYRDHKGLNGTCAALQRALAILTAIRRDVAYTVLPAEVRTSIEKEVGERPSE